jgi:hypothetical protein
MRYVNLDNVVPALYRVSTNIFVPFPVCTVKQLDKETTSNLLDL